MAAASDLVFPRATTMKLDVGQASLELVQGDITSQSVDAIVNAANSRLAGGGGVDGAIHRVGGPEIMRQTRQRYPDGCPTGHAVITDAGSLPSKYVIHAVGPVWQGGEFGEDDLLASAYRQSLRRAVEKNCRSIAFPALSCGAYQFPVPRAARVALEVIRQWFEQASQPERVTFVLFNAELLGQFIDAAKKVFRP